ncbi:MAG: hypothetical protein ACI4EU_04290 [Butyrivibrio sp.]
MNKNQIRNALCEVENLLQKAKEATVLAFVDATDDVSIFHIKEVAYYQNGKSENREFDIRANSAVEASEIYQREYAPDGCTDLMVFLCDFGEE